MRRTHSLTVVVAVVAALLVSGCAEAEPQPKFEPEPSASPTVVEEETAEEFIRRWNDEQREMQKGDTTEYRRIAGECEPCMGAADRIDSIYAAGGYVKTDGRKILSVRKAGKDQPANTYIVDIDSAPTEYKETADAPVNSLECGRNRFRVFLSRRGTDWSLTHFEMVPM